MSINQTVILTRIVNGVLTIVEIFLALRILLKLFGANPNTAFVVWIYQTSQPLVAPFQNIFPSPVLQGQFVLEFTALFALVIYGIAAWLLNELIFFIGDSANNRRARNVETVTTTQTKEEKKK